MELFYHEDIDLNLISGQLSGCGCDRTCAYEDLCCCLKRCGSSYDHFGRLNDFSKPIFECNTECTCDDSCPNRLVQNYLKSYPEFLYECSHSPTMGKGVKSRHKFEKGDLVSVYLGEVITYKEAYQREKNQYALFERNYILIMREYFENELMSETCVDGFGNVGDFPKPISRLINHSCSPNLEVVPVRIDNFIPFLALFANQTIEADYELSYDYAQSIPNEKLHLSKTPCLCRSLKCRKFLPRVSV